MNEDRATYLVDYLPMRPQLPRLQHGHTLWGCLALLKMVAVAEVAVVPLPKVKGGSCLRRNQAVVAVVVGAVGVVVDDGDDDSGEMSVGGSLVWWRSHLVSCGSACERLMLQRCYNPDYKQCIGMVSYDHVF